MANRRKPIPAVSLSCRLFIVFRPGLFRLFPAPCSWQVDRLEPNYNMLQKHTVNGNKKGLPRETFHAMAIAAWIPRR